MLKIKINVKDKFYPTAPQHPKISSGRKRDAGIEEDSFPQDVEKKIKPSAGKWVVLDIALKILELGVTLGLIGSVQENNMVHTVHNEWIESMMEEL